MRLKWPLNDSSFSWLDRLKICGFFLNPSNFWTQNKYVQKFEKEMAAFMEFKYAVYVSSGSAANTILAMNLRDGLKESNSKRNIVVLPSTTWTTSCAPFIREGFQPHFIDVDLVDFSLDLIKLEKYLALNHEKVAAVFPTGLLGFNPYYFSLNQLRNRYPDISFCIDQCENTFGGFDSSCSEERLDFTSTTSTYMGHQLQSVEGGFLFTNDDQEYAKFLMYRNHGMVRSLDDNPFLDLTKLKQLVGNPKIDTRFDFNLLGSNFRNSDINAFIGLLDFKRIFHHISKRRSLYQIFNAKINKNRYIVPDSFPDNRHVPFCFPIICRGEDAETRLREIKWYCMDNEIETRPIISGFLGYQTAYKGMMDKKDYPNSVNLHNNGIYVGLHSKVSKRQVRKLVDFLNRI